MTGPSNSAAIAARNADNKVESKVLAEVCAYTNLAIATGGGIVTQQKNWSYLHHGLIVWLDVQVEVLYERLKEDDSRPLLQTPDPLGKLQSILQQRQPLYKQADLHIRISAEEPAAMNNYRAQSHTG